MKERNAIATTTKTPASPFRATTKKSSSGVPHVDVPDSPGQLLNEIQAASLMQVAVQTLRNDRAKGGERRFPYVKLAKKLIRYRREDLNRVVEAHLITQAHDPGKAHLADGHRAGTV